MKLIWTKSNLPLSIFIRWGLKEATSHFAIVFDEKIVFHSNLLGTNIKWFNTFKNHCEIVHEINYKLSLDQEEEIYQKILNTYDDKKYDYPAFLYLIWRGILRRFFNKPFPEINAWKEKDTYLCTQLATSLPDFLVPELKNITDLGMTSPEALYNIIK